jgi:hypothetical protein
MYSNVTSVELLNVALEANMEDAVDITPASVIVMFVPAVNFF